jgi:L-threonylcarbamoyladenylate synthase
MGRNIGDRARWTLYRQQTMQILTVDSRPPDAATIERAAEVLRRGGLVAFPTETVYGLGANALDAAAIGRIYAAKGRPAYNPLIVHVADEASARELVIEWPERASRVARAFWPGPVTIVLRKRSIVPDAATAGLDAVALRVPAHPVALALLRAAAVPLAAPSANRSMQVSPTTAQHVAASLGEAVDLILDAGPTTVGIESTVLDLREPRAAILRPGMIGPAELEPLVGPLAQSNDARGEVARPSPGMLDRHYAPRARVLLFAASDWQSVREEAVDAMAKGTRVAFLTMTVDAPRGAVIERMPIDAAGYAQRLYAALHAADDAGSELLYVEHVPEESRWLGVRDRLERASR